FKSAMYFIYILYSPSADKYYVGSSDDPKRRLLYHNSDNKPTKFTFRYRPWNLCCVIPTRTKSRALILEKLIKKQKSRDFVITIVIERSKSERSVKIASNC